MGKCRGNICSNKSFYNKLAGGLSGSLFDPDAATFFTAASLTDPTEKNAINDLVLDLKAANLWNKITALYPFVGGSASSCSYNLKDPAQFQIDWYGSMTFSSNGIIGGVNGYGNTNCKNNIDLVDKNSHWCFYFRNKSTSDGWNGWYNFSDLFGVNTSNMFVGLNNFTSSGLTYQNGFMLGYTNGTSSKMYLNDGTSNTFGTVNTISQNYDFYIMALNQNGSPVYYANNNIALCSIGGSMNDTDAANYKTAIQTFQTTLGRNV